jgi:hypothetical protein
MGGRSWDGLKMKVYGTTHRRFYESIETDFVNKKVVFLLLPGYLFMQWKS